MKIGMVLKEPTEREQQILATVGGDELQPDGQAPSIEATRQGHGRVT